MKSFRICPECGSNRIEYASTMVESGSFIGIGLPEMFYCKDCKYKGPLVIEIDKKGAKQYKKIVTKRKKISHEHKKLKKKQEVLRPVFVMVLALFLIITLFFMLPSTRDYKGGKTFVVEEKEVAILNVQGNEIKIDLNRENTAAFNVSGGKVFVRISPQGDRTRITVSSFNLEERVSVQLMKEEGDLISLTQIEPPGPIQSSTGIDTVTGFVLPLFLTVFVLGIVVLMIYSHWHRMRAFL